MKFLFRRLFVLGAFLVTTACASLAQDITPPPGYEYVPPATQDINYYPSVPPDPIAGSVIYVEKCQPCHGEQGLGNGPDANGLPNPVAAIGTAELARNAHPSEWFRIVTEGRIDRFMPPFLSLTERQRWDVLAYVMTLSAPADSVEQGNTLFQEKCASCHGENGLGDGVEAINFDTMPSFADQLLMAKRSKADLLRGMAHPNLPEIPDMTIDLGEADRWAITDYLRSLTFAPDDEETGFANPLATTEASPQDNQPGEEQESENPSSLSELGVIRGQVVNLSGGEVPVDQEVILRGFDQFQEVISMTTTIQEDGTFRFEGVDVPEGWAYLVTVEYKDTTYTSDLAVMEAGKNEYELPVTIYETTTSTEGLVISRLHVLFEFTTVDQVRVAELILISNESNRVVVAGDDTQPVINFTLPDGATNLQFQEGALGRDFVETPNGFGDLRAVVPGNSQVLFSFDMPYNRALEIVQPFELAVQNLIVLSPDIGVEVTGAGLVSGGIQDVQGTPYEVFTGEGLPSGGTLTLGLEGRPDLEGGSVIQTGSTTSLAIGLGALGVTTLIAGVWLFRRRNQGNEEDVADEEDEEVDLSLDQMDEAGLMDAIITLDDRFKAGELPQDAYLQRRAVLKEQLRKKVG